MKMAISSIFFIVFTSINGWLLYISKTTVTEAISFFALCAIISFIILSISEIQEFSIGGNIVKLKEVRKDADKAIEELQLSRIAMFSFLLDMTKKFDGGFASISPKDERIDNFIFLYDGIQSSGLVNKLSKKIFECTELFLNAQLSLINHYSRVDRSRIITPDELTNEALKSTNIFKDTNTEDTNAEDNNRKLTIEAISHYRQLYNIYDKTKP